MNDASPPLPDRFAALRRAMVVSQLRPAGVAQPRLLEAMGRIPREAFLPAAMQASAYIDRAIALGDGRALNPPVTTGLLFDALKLDGTDHLLIVGHATSYATAVARELTDNVIERTPAAIDGGLEGRSFDAILIDGAVDDVPEVLVGALRPGGRLATGLVQRGVTRLALGRRGGHGFGVVAFADGEVVRLHSLDKKPAFVF